MATDGFPLRPGRKTGIHFYRKQYQQENMDGKIRY